MNLLLALVMMAQIGTYPSWLYDWSVIRLRLELSGQIVGRHPQIELPQPIFIGHVYYESAGVPVGASVLTIDTASFSLVGDGKTLLSCKTLGSMSDYDSLAGCELADGISLDEAVRAFAKVVHRDGTEYREYTDKYWLGSKKVTAKRCPSRLLMYRSDGKEWCFPHVEGPR